MTFTDAQLQALAGTSPVPRDDFVPFEIDLRPQLGGLDYDAVELTRQALRGGFVDELITSLAHDDMAQAQLTAQCAYRNSLARVFVERLTTALYPSQMRDAATLVLDLLAAGKKPRVVLTVDEEPA